jgi:hypothetical protein
MANAARFMLSALVILAHSLRLFVGGGLIVVGILGVILPILPGMPFLILGTLVVGRRSRLLRRASVGGKQLLRRWAAHERPLVGRLGRWGLVAQRDSARRLRHLLWWWQARQRTLGQRVRRA